VAQKPREEKWSGSLSLWRFLESAENFPGWHLHGDTKACAHLVEQISQMLCSEVACRLQIPLVPDRPRPVNPQAQWIAAHSLQLVFTNISEQGNYWNLKYENPNLTLTVGREKLIALQSALSKLCTRDDYAIGPDVRMHRRKERMIWDNECLWFWS
jgi:hypothetical protein